MKKISKYGKYFVFLALASAVSFVWSSKDSVQSSLLPSIPQAHADVPVVPGDGQGDVYGSEDCDDGDCN